MPHFIEKFSKTKIGILIDDIAEENGMSAIVAATDDITDQTTNLITTITGGLFYAAVSATRAQILQLKEMPKRATKQSQIQMLASVESRHNVTTGISAADRAQTLRALGDKNPTPRSLVSPGHIFPILAKPGGILEQSTLTEASLDCVTICGFTDAALWVSLINNEGQNFSEQESYDLSQKYDWPIWKLSQLLTYRLSNTPLVEKKAKASLPTFIGGEFKAYVFHSSVYQGEHIALVHGDINSEEPVLTRVQSESTINDVFGISNNRNQLEKSLEKIKQAGRGVLVYLRTTSPGQLAEQLGASNTGAVIKNESSKMTLMRNYGVGAQIIRELGVKKIHLLTSSSKKLDGISLYGLEIVKQSSLE